MFGVKKIWQLQLQVSNICLPTKQRGSDAEADFRRIQNVVTNFRTPDPKCFRKFRIKFGTRKLEAPLFQLSTYISIPLIRLKCD